MILFGFNRHKETDVARIKELSKNWDVFTVSRTEYNEESRATNHEDEKRHLFAKFSDIGKGKKSAILALVRSQKKIHNKVDISLDYVWCANKYFESTYGKGWLQDWVRALLEAGADEVILPYSAEMEEFEKEAGALIGLHVRKQASALWCATVKTPMITAAYHSAKMIGLHSKTPFILFKNGTKVLKGIHTYIHT